MPKYFCVSDIHGFYDELRHALDAVGFDPTNEEHVLVSCGDHFDRGEKPLQVMQYLQSLPRKVLIRGNHEDLLLDMLQRRYPYGYDHQNGTVNTVFALTGLPGLSDYFEDACTKAQIRVKTFIDQMVDYFETANHIFVHAFVPVVCFDGFPAYYAHGRRFEENPDWRNADAEAWEQARWLNPMQVVASGIRPDKTVVAGHWHSSYGHSRASGTPEFGEGADHTPFYTDGLIAIDACTAASGMVNVVVIEDEGLSEKSFGGGTE